MKIKLNENKINKSSCTRRFILGFICLIFFCSFTKANFSSHSLVNYPEYKILEGDEAEKENLTEIYVSEGASIHNSEIISSSSLETITSSQTPLNEDFFLTDGATLYNEDNVSKAKIAALVSEKKNNTEKLSEAKNAIAKILKKNIKQKQPFIFFNSEENSASFSLSDNRKIVFTHKKTEYIFTFFSYTNHPLYSISGEEKQNIAYKNPFITISYLLGKYYARPPNYFS